MAVESKLLTSKVAEGQELCTKDTDLFHTLEAMAP